MLLSEARTIVQDYLDTGNEEDRWSNSAIEKKLNVAMEYCVQMYAAKGGTRMTEQISVVTDATGSIDLSSYEPLVIQNVMISNGGTYSSVTAVPGQNFSTNLTSESTLRIHLVRTPTFPASDGTAFVYGKGISWSLMDELICIKAARMLIIKEQAELDQGLENQFNEILDAALSADTTVSVFDYPTGRDNEYASSYVFQYLPYSLQVGLKG